MQRKHKNYSRPRKLYDKNRILDENKLVETYGLKNKREIWKTSAKVSYLRSRAKELITAEADKQAAFFAKLNEIGLNVNSIADVLALNVQELLKRRLTTILVSRQLAQTPRHARQMISHKRVFIKGRVVSSPGYLIRVDEESVLTVKRARTVKPVEVGAVNG